MVTYRNMADHRALLSYVWQGAEHTASIPPGAMITLPDDAKMTSKYDELKEVSDPIEDKTAAHITLPTGYYILGDGTLYARHLYRRDGQQVKLVALIIDAVAAERIILALNGADNG